MAFIRCPKCALKCGTHYIPYDILRLLKMGFRKLEYSESDSLLKKYFNKELMEHLKFRKTCNGVNLYDCISGGLQNLDSEVGVNACDPESYFVFWPIFFPILQELHGFSPTDVHPKSQWTPVRSVSDLPDYKGKFISLIRIRVTRNLKGYPFCPQMTENDFETVEEYLSMIFSLMTGEYDGHYEKFTEMTGDRKKELREKFIFFDKTNKHMEAVGTYRCWPIGRGVFINSDENFIVRVNPGDHLKVISVGTGGEIRKTYERLAKAVLKLQQDLNFIKSERMGFISSSPSDMGSGFKISIQVVLPKLSENMEEVEEITEKYGVEVEIVPYQKGKLEIFNKKRMGVTEIEGVRSVENAVVELINLELNS